MNNIANWILAAIQLVVSFFTGLIGYMFRKEFSRIDSLEKREEDYGEFALTGSGNTMVFAVKYEDEYAIYVTKEYYESSIPR